MACNCAVTGTSFAVGAAGGDTSSFMLEIARCTDPVHVELMSPETLPASSTLSSGIFAVATDAAILLICTPFKCSLVVPRCGKALLPGAVALQFAICTSPCTVFSYS